LHFFHNFYFLLLHALFKLSISVTVRKHMYVCMKSRSSQKEVVLLLVDVRRTQGGMPRFDTLHSELSLSIL
jgi:hypothetical protein